MSVDDAVAALKLLLLPSFGCVALTSALAYLAVRTLTRPRVEGEGAMVLAFTTLGVISGQAAGFSREPVVGALLPAMLSLVGGLLTYMFTKEGLARWRPVIPYCIVVLAIGGLLGLTLGSTARSKLEYRSNTDQRERLRYEHVELEVEKARHLAEIEVWKHERQKQIDGSYAVIGAGKKR